MSNLIGKTIQTKATGGYSQDLLDNLGLKPRMIMEVYGTKGVGVTCPEFKTGDDDEDTYLWYVHTADYDIVEDK